MHFKLSDRAFREAHALMAMAWSGRHAVGGLDAERWLGSFANVFAWEPYEFVEVQK